MKEEKYVELIRNYVSSMKSLISTIESVGVTRDGCHAANNLNEELYNYLMELRVDVSHGVREQYRDDLENMYQAFSDVINGLNAIRNYGGRYE